MNTQRGKVPGTRREGSTVLGPSIRARMSDGKALRERISRTSHAKWAAPSDRPDPIEILQRSDRGRLPDLLPIRYDRMRQSPFAFFRGSVAVMTWDLSKTPETGIRLQACGDCHTANFGGFASPERRLLFDINDFDETLRAPWEWDIKRLAASVVLASRELGLGGGRCSDAVLTMAESYRQHIREYAQMRANARARGVVFAYGRRGVYRGSEDGGGEKTVAANGEKRTAPDRGAHFSENRGRDKRTDADLGSSATGVPPPREPLDAEARDPDVPPIPQDTSGRTAGDSGPPPHY